MKNKEKTKNQILGKFGEKISQIFLKQNNYEILNTNYRTEIGEIDIIAKDKNVLVFIEVKTRTNKNFKAIDAITRKKQIKISNVANIFIAKNSPKFDNTKVRFDVILIDNNNIKLIKNAFII